MKVPAGGVHMDPHRHARMMHNEHPLFIAEQCWKGSSGVDRSRHCILTCTCADHTPVYGRSTSSAQALCHPAPAPQTLCQLVPSRDMRHWRMAQMCQQHYLYRNHRSSGDVSSVFSKSVSYIQSALSISPSIPTRYASAPHWYLLSSAALSGGLVISMPVQ